MNLGMEAASLISSV